MAAIRQKFIGLLPQPGEAFVERLGFGLRTGRDGAIDLDMPGERTLGEPRERLVLQFRRMDPHAATVLKGDL